MLKGLKAEDGPDKGGFAAAVGSEQGDELPSLDAKVDVLEHVLSVEFNAGSLDIDDTHVHPWPAMRVERFLRMTSE